jgi:hypothetical protein
MAIFYLHIKTLNRRDGRSATAAAAYRAAERLQDVTSGRTVNHSRKQGVTHTEILLPSSTSAGDVSWARDRQQLWNTAELAERRSNSRVAREYVVALPHELAKAQRLELARSFAAEIANRHGVAVDLAIHEPDRLGDNRNHHAHLLASTRVLAAEGFGKKSPMEWSNLDRREASLISGQDEYRAIRARWAELVNAKLLEQGLAVRIDHRSLEAQGIDREPTWHKGQAVTAMERRGIVTEVGTRMALHVQEATQRRQERAAELARLQPGDHPRGPAETGLQSQRTESTALAGQALSAKEPHPPRQDAIEKWLRFRSDHSLDSQQPGQTGERELSPGASLNTARALQQTQQAEREREDAGFDL